MENLRSKTNGRPFEREIVKFEFKLESSTFVLYFLGGLLCGEFVLFLDKSGLN